MSENEPDAVDTLSTELRIAIARMFRRLRAERGDDQQLGETQSSILAFLVREGPHTLRGLAEHERVTPPSMNQTTTVLVEAGYVVREQDPSDGRKVLFAPTPAGTALALENRRRKHAWLHSHLVDLAEDERRTLEDAARILRRIADAS